ncbi:helix-turn-helix transcriptional regulator [Streptomyces sp. NPDC019507]|uniref:helix-turn-helix domain-containing protein n=1 Tax=Streptomyces sp. NPDC019507 TaxID=3154689 RepID=UPI0033D68DB3
MTPSVSDRVATAVRAARKNRGWTRERFAEQCAVKGYAALTYAALTNIERSPDAPEGRQRRISVDELVALAEVLGLKPEQLLASPYCDACKDMPPPGFTCNQCLAATPLVNGSDCH